MNRTLTFQKKIPYTKGNAHFIPRKRIQFCIWIGNDKVFWRVILSTAFFRFFTYLRSAFEYFCYNNSIVCGLINTDLMENVYSFVIFHCKWQTVTCTNIVTISICYLFVQKLFESPLSKSYTGGKLQSNFYYLQRKR